jgi:hypothetical protein
MSGGWRHTPAGTGVYIGIVIAATGVAIATDAHFSPVVRTLALLAVLTVAVVAMIWSWRVLRSRGRRVTPRGRRNRRPGV